MTISGDFETHLTIASPEAVEAGHLQMIAAECGLKVTHILLDRGQRPSQPMLTRHSVGTLDDALAAARGLAALLASSGLKVCRTKLEIDAINPAAPSIEGETKANPAEWYFEYHIKVLLPSLSDLEPLSKVAQRNASRLSRNAFLRRPDGQEERFLTRRFYAAVRLDVFQALTAVTADLQENGFAVLDYEAEYVVFDSNVALDAGWLDAS
ncbi:MAG TPA: hypothetical protein VGM54_08310 [Chthoniobacter sp.]